MKKLIAILFLALAFAFPSASFAASEKPPINIYGEWLCYRYFEGEIEGGGSKDAKEAIGEKIDFGINQIAFFHPNKKSFLSFPDGLCKGVAYKWERVNLNDDTSNSYLQLSYRGPLKEESNPIVYVLETSSEVAHFAMAFELSKSGELAYYFNGQVFFFRKITSL